MLYYQNHIQSDGRQGIVVLELTRIKAKTTEGIRSFWAEVLRPGVYRRVNKYGNHNNHLYILSTNDIIKEQPATLDKKYGTMRVIQ